MSAGARPARTQQPLALRILVAEDNEVNQTVALRLLERLGHRADVVSTGREALARLEHAAYDVVLMDVQMPDLDGLETSRALCARWPANQRPRIVAMTAEALPGDREKCLAAGMDDYIVKPVMLSQLEEALARCAPSGRAPAQAAPEPVVEDREGVAAAVLDRRVLEQLVKDLGGAAPLENVIATFLEKTPSVLVTLREAAARADAAQIREAAHRIKGASAMLGARTLAGQCAELEQLVRRGHVLDAADRVAAIEAAYRKVEAALTPPR